MPPVRSAYHPSASSDRLHADDPPPPPPDGPRPAPEEFKNPPPRDKAALRPAAPPGELPRLPAAGGSHSTKKKRGPGGIINYVKNSLVGGEAGSEDENAR